MKSAGLIAFKGFIIITVSFNLLLRMASEHTFFLPPEEKLGYLAMIVALVLVSYLPSVNKGRLIMKCITLVAVMGVIAMAVFLWTMLFTEGGFESLVVGLIFHTWCAAFLLTSVYVLFLVATNGLFKKENRTNQS